MSMFCFGHETIASLKCFGMNTHLRALMLALRWPFNFLFLFSLSSTIFYASVTSNPSFYLTNRLKAKTGHNSIIRCVSNSEKSEVFKNMLHTIDAIGRDSIILTSFLTSSWVVSKFFALMVSYLIFNFLWSSWAESCNLAASMLY